LTTIAAAEPRKTVTSTTRCQAPSEQADRRVRAGDEEVDACVIDAPLAPKQAATEPANTAAAAC
jgi:hypothetical protein